MEARNVPRSAPATPFEKAREALHVAAVPKALPCREREFEEIESYVEEAILDGSGSCIYISGVPGNGKTATVTRVIDSLQEKSERGDLDPFTFVEINGMKLLDPSQAYVILWEAISGERLSAKHASEMLERKFSRSSAQSRPIVVIMDELDLMVTQKHTVMYNFFEWPTREQSQLIVIAIANTMDLPERMLNNRVASRLAMKRITFQPYTVPQLKTIIRSRLDGVELFEDSAIEFCARKVASVSGDARRALDICRRAVEIADLSASGDVSKMKNKINAQNLMSTFNEMYASANVTFVKHAPLQQKLFLVALATRIRRSGLYEVPFHEVAEEHIRLCQMHKFEVPNGSQLSAICANLGTSRAIAVEDIRLDLYRAVRLVLSEQDVYHALQEDPKLRVCLPQDLQAALNG
ncbi:P-loop containing nucleoside triphosphate hydrolase protein [Hyaloraphidium curvatum]|nr:P-loop containing nucleoside triphosphate hydrolase protein [Hyaloraphidium curvatum]